MKSSIAYGIRSVGRLPPLSHVLFHPDIKRSLQSLPGFQVIYGSGWDLLHPFDRCHGTQTSGFVPAEQLAGTAPTHYCGSQPSIVRRALAQLPSVAGFTFIDLGAGKGRPALVAAELPFSEVIGVELSGPLVEVARKNVSLLRRRHPDRAPVRIVNANAAAFPFPVGDLVIFLYHPFGEEIVRKVVDHIERALTTTLRSLFVVYYNPVHGDCFDASPRLQRYYAATIPYAVEERGFGPDEADPVVIWQGGTSLPACEGSDVPIRVTRPGNRCELGSSSGP